MIDTAQPGLRTGAQNLLILPRMHGFFSLVFGAVGQAYLAEKAGMTPVVYFNRHCPYWSDAGYNGERNLWNYFFEPLSSVSVQELFPGIPTKTLESYGLQQFQELCAGTRVTATSEYPEEIVEYKSPIALWSKRKFVHDLLNRYAVLKPNIRGKVEAYQRANFTSYHVIGVHYRGVEKSIGKTKDGVVPKRTTSLKAFYLSEVRTRLRSVPSAKIFVATDSAQFLEMVQQEFGDAVLCRAATRLSEEEEIVGLHFKQHAELAKPLLAEEVLLDSLLLARTDFLIHGVSNVSNAALFFNAGLPHFDVELRQSPAFYLKKELVRQVARFAPAVITGLQQRASRNRS